MGHGVFIAVLTCCPVLLCESELVSRVAPEQIAMLLGPGVGRSLGRGGDDPHPFPGQFANLMQVLVHRVSSSGWQRSNKIPIDDSAEKHLRFSFVKIATLEDFFRCRLGDTVAAAVPVHEIESLPRPPPTTHHPYM